MLKQEVQVDGHAEPRQYRQWLGCRASLYGDHPVIRIADVTETQPSLSFADSPAELSSSSSGWAAWAPCLMDSGSDCLVRYYFAP